jgi:hypothetical protein
VILKPVHYVLNDGWGLGQCRPARVIGMEVDAANLDVELDAWLDRPEFDGPPLMSPWFEVLNVPYGVKPGTWHTEADCPDPKKMKRGF